MNTLFHEVCGGVIDDCTVHSALMSSDDVMSAIKKFKPATTDMTGCHQINYYYNDTPLLPRYISALFIIIKGSSLSARILHRAPPRLQVDQNFLTQKIVADPKMRCHQKSFGIWRVTEAILGQKTCFFFKKHILEKIHNKSHYFLNF